MSALCCGARDKSAPKDVIWKTVPHRLLFAGSSHHYWGIGGCAVLHPESDSNEESHVCIYKITYVRLLCQYCYLFSLLVHIRLLVRALIFFPELIINYEDTFNSGENQTQFTWRIVPFIFFLLIPNSNRYQYPQVIFFFNFHISMLE